jgi:hypothetical protein
MLAISIQVLISTMAPATIHAMAAPMPQQAITIQQQQSTTVHVYSM